MAEIFPFSLDSMDPILGSLRVFRCKKGDLCWLTQSDFAQWQSCHPSTGAKELAWVEECRLALLGKGHCFSCPHRLRLLSGNARGGAISVGQFWRVPKSSLSLICCCHK